MSKSVSGWNSGWNSGCQSLSVVETVDVKLCQWLKQWMSNSVSGWNSGCQCICQWFTMKAASQSTQNIPKYHNYCQRTRNNQHPHSTAVCRSTQWKPELLLTLTLHHYTSSIVTGLETVSAPHYERLKPEEVVAKITHCSLLLLFDLGLNNDQVIKKSNTLICKTSSWT